MQEVAENLLAKFSLLYFEVYKIKSKVFGDSFQQPVIVIIMMKNENVSKATVRKCEGKYLNICTTLIIFIII